MNHALLPTIRDAQLPARYESAKAAIAECDRVDECKDWADKSEWAVMEILNDQGDPEGRAKEFYRLCAYQHVYRAVKSAVDRYGNPDKSEEHDLQLHLKGFQHLQVAYTVDRDGERTLVPIDLISADDLLARAAGFEIQSKALRDHAKEIKMYVARRAGGRSQAA